ncbi:hypothetical protein [Moraxella sp. K1664]|uniref:hypothetical protein n=1 Tax=Moraxella sp. K1664 TaxID=2780077 RepID=UPI001880C896|nr:hypothetical protein [Moraxella sp. K1664]MBE9577679.1 hypothetical protein [Moraxella sp. K1664]
MIKTIQVIPCEFNSSIGMLRFDLMINSVALFVWIRLQCIGLNVVWLTTGSIGDSVPTKAITTSIIA